MLQIVDAQWKDHLYSLDHLKEGIGLRGYGQRDPLVEYKKESFTLFQAMKDRIDEEMVRYLWRLRPVSSRRAARPIRARRSAQRPCRRDAPRPDHAQRRLGRPRRPGCAACPAGPPRRLAPAATTRRSSTVRRDEPKIGRNDPCWCGSGKKYKKCHGAVQGR